MQFFLEWLRGSVANNYIELFLVLKFSWLALNIKLAWYQGSIYWCILPPGLRGNGERKRKWTERERPISSPYSSYSVLFPLPLFSFFSPSSPSLVVKKCPPHFCPKTLNLRHLSLMARKSEHKHQEEIILDQIRLRGRPTECATLRDTGAGPTENLKNRQKTVQILHLSYFTKCKII